jgi:cobalt-zinc-cadmium efflux system outer membrane protein
LARARQAGALTNPTLSYGYEQTAVGNERNSQMITALEQPLELTGVRSARQEAARWLAEGAAADLGVARAEVAFEVTQAYALAQAAGERLALAERAAAAFDRAQRITGARLAAGDVSGYEARRVRLEGARYAAVRSEAALARRTAYLALAALTGMPPDSLVAAGLVPLESLPPGPAVLDRDSIVALALQRRPELRAGEAQVAAARANARAAGRERIPLPIISAGWKTEQISAAATRLNGFVAGVSLALPFWDRRGGAVSAANAEARAREADVELLRRQVIRDVEETHASLLAVVEDVQRLSAVLGPEATAALQAAETAYAEGEIGLVEWLDAVRAYHEAESSYATLRAELYVRRAALERATGAPPMEDSQP